MACFIAGSRFMPRIMAQGEGERLRTPGHAITDMNRVALDRCVIPLIDMRPAR
jgi:hypothetical protein